MPDIKRHKTFLKDYASIRLTDGQFEKLVTYIATLKEGKQLPKESKDHSLKGEWSDFRECHLGGDMLLVYYHSLTDVVLARLGRHSKLFG